jgi:hypothetical protein
MATNSIPRPTFVIFTAGHLSLAVVKCAFAPTAGTVTAIVVVFTIPPLVAVTVTVPVSAGGGSTTKVAG